MPKVNPYCILPDEYREPHFVNAIMYWINKPETV